MTLIAAGDRRNGIGFKGDLLIKLSGDMAYFKEKTMGNTIVMGRKTMESLPGKRPLPGRRNIVLSRSVKAADGFEVCADVNELLNLTGSAADVFVIGGGQIYNLLLPFCSEALITEIDAEFEADTWLPSELRGTEWELSSRSEPVCENGITYVFAVYRRCVNEKAESAALRSAIL